MNPIEAAFVKNNHAVVKARKHLEYLESKRDALTSEAARLMIEQSGLSLRSFAEKAGLSAPYLSDAIRGRRGWGVDALEKIRAAFPAKTKPSRKSK